MSPKYITAFMYSLQKLLQYTIYIYKFYNSISVFTTVFL